MILYTFIAVSVMALAAVIRPTEERMSRQRILNTLGVAAIFIILTALAAFRIEVGNDYGTYVNTCHEIRWDGYVVTEPGFNIFVKTLYILSGSENYLLMFGVFAAMINFVFLRSFMEESDSFFWSVSLFMLLGIYYRSFSTVRYYFVLAIALWSLKYVSGLFYKGEDGREHIKIQNLVIFLAVIGIAALFHKSVLVVIPMYIVCRLPWKKWVYPLIAVIGVALFILKDKVMELALILYPSYKNTEYLEETRLITDNIPTLIRIGLVLILCFICYKEAIEDREDNKLYMKMNILAIVLYLSCYYIPFVSRFGYYLITAQILLVPNIIRSVKDPGKRHIIETCVLAVAFVYFAYFLKTAYNEGLRVLPYKSWLFDSVEFRDQTDLTDTFKLTLLDKYLTR